MGFLELIENAIFHKTGFDYFVKVIVQNKLKATIATKVRQNWQVSGG